MQDSRSKDPHRDAVTMTANCHRRRSRLHTYAVAICLAMMMSLVGCTLTPTDPNTSASAPDISRPATTTATSTAEQPTPPPTTAAVYKPATADGPAQNVPVPVLPEKAKEFSKEGLLAFAEHWYSTLGYVFETGDSEPMMEISDQGCKTCPQINEPVGTWYTEGGWIVGGQMIVLQSTTTFVETPEATYQAILLVRQNKVSYYKSDGSRSFDYPQDIAEKNIVIASYKDARWLAHTAEPMVNQP